MYERKLVPMFWDNQDYGYRESTLKNLDYINDNYLSKGWEVERVDELHDKEGTTLMYILRKENDENE